MALTPSELTLQIKSQGIKQAADDLKNLAEAAKSVDAETRSFVISQAKLQASQEKTKDSTKQTNQALIEQKRDYELWRMAGASATKTVNDALKNYNQTTKEYTQLWKQMDTQKLLEQTQQYKLYTIEVKRNAEALKEAARLEKAHGDALEMNKKFDIQRAAAIAKGTETIKMNARGISEQEFAMVKAHEAALKMNAAFDKKNAKLEEAHKRGSVYLNTLRSMATAALAYVGVNFAAGIIKEADAWAMMQAKLKIATGSMANALTTQQNLYELAQKIRIPLEDSIKLYTRLAQPLMMMGKTSKDAIGMVESLGTALKLSGATGQEAASAMLQFSQAMNAGRLNGGEFNSIAEASPNILRAIEAELRRTGQWGENTTETLKKMGSEGKITGELLYRSLTNALPQFRKDFENLPLTVDGALERLKNAWLKAIGEMGQDTQFTAEFARSIKSLEESLPAIAKGFGAVFNFVAQNLKEISVAGGLLVGGGMLLWVKSLYDGFSMIVSAGVLAKMVAGIEAMTAASISFMATPLGAAILAITAAVYAGKKAYDWYVESQNEAVKAQESYKAGSPSLLKTMKDEEDALDRQIVALRVKAGLMKQPVVEGTTMRTYDDLTEVEKLTRSLTDTSKEYADTLKREGSESVNLADKMARIKNLTQQLTEAKLAEDRIAGKTKEVTSLTERIELNAKLADDLKKWSKDKSSLMQKEIAEIDAKYKYEEDLEGKKIQRLRISQKDYNTIINGIREKYKTTEDNKASKELTALEKANLELEKTVKLREQLEKDPSGGSKLTEGEKMAATYLAQVEHLTKQEKTLKGVELAKNKNLQVDLKNAIAVENLRTAEEKRIIALKEANQQVIEKNNQYLKSAENVEAEVQKYNDLIDTYGKTAGAIDLEILKRKEKELSQKTELKLTDEQVAALKREIDARKELAGRKDQYETLEKATAEAKKYEDAYQAANKKIADGLYNAIGKSGENAVKKLIRDIREWFARLILNPIIQPISQIGASIISPNAASATGGIANSLSQLGSVASSAYNFLSNPMTWGTQAASALASGISSVGSTLGSGFLSSIGAGASGMSVAQASAAGVSSATGFGIGSGLSSLATVAPYVLAATALYKGLSMGEKQKTGSTITGNLGTDNLMRNVSWTQQGGFLRSDRSGTWSYGLNNSTAVQDGKAYQDTASMESDKALLNQLNSMYDAVKIASTEYAKALGINAESIKARTDAINFAFGKTAEETSANINKAFEDITNVIAKDLLGDLIQLANVGESSAQTMGRLATNISATNGMFKALGYNLYELNVSGIKAADGLVKLFGGLDQFKAIASDYYDKFYSEEEKMRVKVNALTGSFKTLGTELPASRAAFRGLVEAAQKAGNNELYVSLMKLSSAFAEITETSSNSVSGIDSVKSTLDSLAQETERWLNIRNRAATMKDSVDELLGNPKRDPAIRMQQLWDAMSKDVSVEQRLDLAEELKNLVISKYQTEKESLQKLIDFGRQLRGYVDSLKVGQLSPLTMTDKLSEAQRQYVETLTKAQAGDTIAQGMLQGKSDTYLQLAQTALASSSEYTAIFNSVTSSLDALGIQSMSAEEIANGLSQNQLDELRRLSDFLGTTETTANTFYNSSLNSLASQINLLDSMNQKLGVFGSVVDIVGKLPAEIAAALSGRVGTSIGDDAFIRGLYQSVEGRTGSAIDTAGYNYWMKDLATSTREQLATNFAAASAENAARNAIQQASSSSLEAKIETLTTELKGLREDQNNNAMTLAEIQQVTSANSTAAIVEATKGATKESSWQDAVKPELI